jgi:hypothetical protein
VRNRPAHKVPRVAAGGWLHSLSASVSPNVPRPVPAGRRHAENFESVATATPPDQAKRRTKRILSCQHAAGSSNDRGPANRFGAAEPIGIAAGSRPRAAIDLRRAPTPKSLRLRRGSGVRSAVYRRVDSNGRIGGGVVQAVRPRMARPVTSGRGDACGIEQASWFSTTAHALAPDGARMARRLTDGKRR